MQRCPVRTSVVVPTYRRPEALKRCLDALAHQDSAPDEIIVVARREDDATRTVVRKHGKLIRLVLIDVPAGRPGVVRALNEGIAASSGEIVCLIDDDAEARPDWISRILETFATDPRIGAVGGRDWVFYNGQLEDGANSNVGTISWFGRVTGNHHLGVGPPRDVAVLKGVNLSVRGELVRQVGFDTRLLGIATEHHWEIGLCLRLVRMGCRIVYDPAVAVDHRPQPRVAEPREFGSRQVRDAVHNETLALLEHLPHMRRAAHLFWTTAIGTRGAPGLAQSARLLLSTGDPKLQLLLGNLTGRGLAVLTYLRSPGGRVRAGRRAWEPSGRSADTPSVLAVAQSPSLTDRATQRGGQAHDRGQAEGLGRARQHRRHSSE